MASSKNCPDYDENYYLALLLLVIPVFIAGMALESSTNLFENKMKPWCVALWIRVCKYIRKKMRRERGTLS